MWRPALAESTIQSRDRGVSSEESKGPSLIADGHHRYETALRFHEEEGTEATAYVLAVLRRPGRRRPRDLPDAPGHRRCGPRAGRARSADAAGRAGRGRRRRSPASGATIRRSSSCAPTARSLVEGSEQALDTALVDSLPLSDVEYTASAAEAERAVSSGGGDRCVHRAAADRAAGRGVRASRRAHASEEHLLLPEADERPPPLPLRRVTVARLRLAPAGVTMFPREPLP